MTDKSVKEKLFQEFPPVSTSDWIKRIEQDLIDVAYDKLMWSTPEGINVQPFYRHENLSDKSYLQTLPGVFPFIRGNKQESNEWEIRQDILVNSIKNANTAALDSLNGGASSLGFIIPESLKFDNKKFKHLLSGIQLDCIGLNFISHTRSDTILGFLEQEIHKQSIEPSHIKGSIDFDPLGYMSKYGKFYLSEKDEFSLLAKSIRRISSTFPELRIIGINSHLFHDAGSSIIQDLGFGLAIFSEYMDRLTNHGLSAASIGRTMQVNFAIGSVYFMEIARIRAARLLFAQLKKAWGITDDNSLKTYIHCRTSEWTQTVYDPYINMLRSTSQAMSAAIGGVDSISVIPYDKAFRHPSIYSERLSRNIQIILKEESYFDKVADPSSGSYYIESLTDSMVKDAWNLFLQIEDQGGYLTAFKNGHIHKLIHETSVKKDLRIATREDILVGINKYANLSEQIQDDFDPAIAFPIKNKTERIIAEPLQKYRGSKAFEDIRMKTERSKTGIPKVFLLGFGNLNSRRARADFATSFFSCGGFEIIDNHGFDSILEGIEASKRTNANIVVLCAHDKDYLSIVPVALEKLSKDTILIIAGYPTDSLEELKSMGVKYFIHAKSNVLKELMEYQELLGL